MYLLVPTLLFDPEKKTNDTIMERKVVNFRSETSLKIKTLIGWSWLLFSNWPIIILHSCSDWCNHVAKIVNGCLSPSVSHENSFFKNQSHKMSVFEEKLKLFSEFPYLRRNCEFEIFADKRQVSSKENSYTKLGGWGYTWIHEYLDDLPRSR